MLKFMKQAANSTFLYSDLIIYDKINSVCSDAANIGRKYCVFYSLRKRVVKYANSNSNLSSF